MSQHTDHITQGDNELSPTRVATRYAMTKARNARVRIVAETSTLIVSSSASLYARPLLPQEWQQ